MSKTVSSATLYSWNELPTERVAPHLSRKLISGERAMLAQVELKQGGVIPKHEHMHEQFTHVISGALKFLIGDDNPTTVTVRTGGVLHLPSHVPHEALVLEDTLLIDVFSPPREDWLNKTDDYLRKK